jgi:hypothetical protein
MGRLFTPMTRVKKKFFAVTALVVAGVFLTLPIFLSVTALASGGGGSAGGPPPEVLAAQKAAAAASAAEGGGEGGEEVKVEVGRDVYYKIEGPAVGMPAPVTADNETFYPRYNFESRVLLWVANQQHLYYGSFVLAVPIFCMCIEFAGMVSKDKAMAKKYD